MNQKYRLTKLSNLLERVERFEEVDPLEEYHFAGTYSFARGIFAGERKLGSDFKLPKVQRIHEGDFVYCKIMAWEGAFGLVPKEVHNCVMSGAFVAYKVDRTQIDPNYLAYYFKVPSIWKQVGGQSTGTNIRRRSLHPLQFENTNIPLPPLEEQQRIVARIKELAAKIEEARGLRGEAVEEEEVLMDTVTHSLFDELEQHNAKRSLRKSAKILGGGTPSKGNIAFWQGTIPWVSPKDMKVRNLYDSEDHISELALHKGATTLIPQNSILIVVRSGILRRKLPVSINRVPVTINQDMKALIPDNDILCDFLAWWFKGKERAILKHVKGGTTVQSVVWDSVREFSLSVPPLSEQSHIVDYLDSLQSKVDTMKQLQAETSAELDALLPSILDKAFKGEL